MVNKINKNKGNTVYVDENNKPIKGFFFHNQKCKRCTIVTKHKIEFVSENGKQLIKSITCTNCR